jgi:DNA repair exonuclease SbcCD ATPase subunit
MNCLIGIQGSGKSSILECLRYALDIPFGDVATDKEYKIALLTHALRSGGTVIVEAFDKHGVRYEIRRILGHAADVYVDGKLRQGVSIRETIIGNPVYFGQKDLSNAGKGFGKDLVEKLVGESLRSVRNDIAQTSAQLEAAIEVLVEVEGDAEEKERLTAKLQDVTFRIEQLDKHGVKSKLEKRIEFRNDTAFCNSVDEASEEWRDALSGAIASAEESFAELALPQSKANIAFFKKYGPKLDALKKTLAEAKVVLKAVEDVQKDLHDLGGELARKAESLKEEFAEAKREILKALRAKGVDSVEPDDYVKYSAQKSELEADITALNKKTSKKAARQAKVVELMVKLNDEWLTEFKQVSSALSKVNKAQGALKVEAKFKEDKAAFRNKMEMVFSGTGLRKEVYEALSMEIC